MKRYSVTGGILKSNKWREREKKQEEEKEEAGVLHSWGNFLLVPPQHSLTTTEGVHYSHFTFH